MNTRIIPTKVHGSLDYLASGVNLAFPRLLGLHDAPWAARVPHIDGAAGAGYSLITAYEFGALKVLPMPAHLAFDAVKAPSWPCRPGSSASPRTAPATGCRTC